MRSIHPRQIDALVAERALHGWTLGPPWPDDAGVAYFTAPDGSPWPTPPHPGPSPTQNCRPSRPLRIAPLTTAVAVWCGLAAVVALAVR